MIGQLGGCKSFAAKGAVIDGTIRITGDLGNFTALGIDQNATAAMTHSAMAFDNPVKSVGLHFLFNIRIFKFSHVFLLNILAVSLRIAHLSRNFDFPVKQTHQISALQAFHRPI